MKISKIVIALLLIMTLSATAIGQEWKVPITFKSGGTGIELEFGTDISATRGFDEGIDEPVPPPAPGQTKNAYFDISEYEEEDFLQKLWKDYRPTINQSNPKEIWRLHVKSDEEIKLEWDTSSVPEYISLKMEIKKDGKIIEDVNMNKESSCSLPNGTYETYITAEYDLIPPNISNISPVEDIYASTIPVEVTISANYSDNVGIDVYSVKLMVNGVDVTSDAIVTEKGISYKFSAKEGTYNVYLEVADLAGNKVNKTWSFKVSQKVCINISLRKGWNMISLPVKNATINVPNSVLFKAYWYNPETKSYKSVPIKDMEPGKGYWVYAKDDCDITVCGIPLFNYSIELKKGWNMIGALFLSVDSSKTDPPNSVLTNAYWYNPETKSYKSVPIKDMEPGKGYWVYAKDDCRLHVASKPPSPPS